jgi:malate dehydrogenase (oxaloacetate-decarboxylating)
MDYYQDALTLHYENKGKIEIISKVPLRNKYDLSVAYTPGVAAPCLKIKDDGNRVYDYTAKGNMVAVITDGSAVLGLGNIGAKAALPVMEGKALLFKEFANVDAFPICIETQDADQIVSIIKNISPGFGAINLEDISAPRCFEIENRLQEEIDIPVFHDDQHGTAIVTLAALINTMRLLGKELNSIKVAINGAGAAGNAIAKILIASGVRDIVICDRKGIICRNREGGLDQYKEELSRITNPAELKGTIKEAVMGRDVFIGVSSAGALTPDMVRTMNKDAVIFALANPEPEIMPDAAKEAGARVVGTGRSDFPNQINNTLIFPGLLRGALDARAKRITQDMKIAAAYALASSIGPEELHESYILPSPLQRDVAEKVAKAVANAWSVKMEK